MMLPTELARTIAREYGTPALVADLDIVERNIERVQSLLANNGLLNRPHIKTHKSPLIANMQIKAGAHGITCQKIGEAEVMAEAGTDNILIAYNLLGDEKMARLGRLLRGGARLTVAADNPTVIHDLTRAAKLGETSLGVVIECDTGRKRAGVETAAEAVALAERVASLPGLTFQGFLFYPPEDRWRETQAFLTEALSGVRGLGLEPHIVSTGGSPNLRHIGGLTGATEHRPGTYVFNDRMQIAAGVATLEDIGLLVVSTVVSRAGSQRGIIDAGSKTLTSDKGNLDGHGLILDYAEARISQLSEEHGFLDLSQSAARPSVGEVLRIVPNHVCVVVNMVDEIVTIRGNRIQGILKVAARGRLR